MQVRNGINFNQEKEVFPNVLINVIFGYCEVLELLSSITYSADIVDLLDANKVLKVTQSRDTKNISASPSTLPSNTKSKKFLFNNSKGNVRL